MSSGYALCQMHSDAEDECVSDSAKAAAASCNTELHQQPCIAAVCEHTQSARVDTVDFAAVFGADASVADEDEWWQKDGASHQCCSCSVARVRQLEDELVAGQRALKERDEQVDKLTHIRDDIESEVQELTASLFQEAHKMVLAANEKQAAAEKCIQERDMKIDVLQAELAALKTLLLPSTPNNSRPGSGGSGGGRHLHPETAKTNGISIFKRGHRRTPSSQESVENSGVNGVNGGDCSPPHSPALSCSSESRSSDTAVGIPPTKLLTEPRFLSIVRKWRAVPTLDPNDEFISELHRQDVLPCLDFAASSSPSTPAVQELNSRVISAVYDATVAIETLRLCHKKVTHDSHTTSDATKSDEPDAVAASLSSCVRLTGGSSGSGESTCALLGDGLECSHRLRLSDESDWINISRICRNRVTAACELVNYLRYIQQGLVKSSDCDVYRRIMELRREMTLARLGFCD